MSREMAGGGMVLGIPMFFRQMRREDAGEIHVIETAVFPSPWSQAGFITSVDCGYNCWVMCEEQTGRIAGYFILMTSIDEAHLLTIGLKAALHGMGYGRMLMDRAMLTARAHGMVSMLLEVRPSNTGPLGMYRKYGFQQIGIRKNYYRNMDGTREDAIVMRVML
ncbi:MAG: ribosomal protein S18-alanine N-acetyltransferase [Alistipes senegalensis]|nr:ribosomal protein S18-alanine N-acetyltransferase [Oxalobacter formigenes]MCM1281120.1 ribosomal protein S18-alanine N-acetyltransferase [Alistipes senegalensis]